MTTDVNKLGSDLIQSPVDALNSGRINFLVVSASGRAYTMIVRMDVKSLDDPLGNGPRLCENTQMWYASCDTWVHLCQVSLKGLIGIR